MNAIPSAETIESVLLVDRLNEKPLYVPSHDFKYYYAYNEFTDLAPLFYNEGQHLKWFLEQIDAKTYCLRLHVCDVNEIMQKIVIKFKNIEKISFHFFILNKNCFEFLVKNCQNIKSINFENSLGIGFNECLLLTRLPKLRHLNLNGCDIYEENLEIILKNCQKLKSLNISNNFSVTGHCMVWTNRSVKRLDLRDCWNINAKQIITTVRLGLSSLIELLVNSGVNDESLTEICNNCKNIRHLNISFDYFAYNDIYGRRILSDLGFASIGKLENLQILTLRHVGKLTDIGLQSILKGCKNLIQLVINVRHRHKLTDIALADIGVLCPKLEYFESVHNHFIGKLSLISISQIKNLEALVLRGNELVDNEVIRVLSDCKKLLYISLDGCNVNHLVLLSCIQRANELKENNQIFKASLIRTNIDRSAVNENVLPTNLRIRVSGPNNLEHFSEFDGKDVKMGSLQTFFPNYWIDLH